MDWNSPGGSKAKKIGSTDFRIRIIYRKNACWQGEISRLDNNKKMFFRSLMELMMLMQEAVAENDTPKAEYSLRSWAEITSGKDQYLENAYLANSK